jgi:hypothetical protein
MIDLIDVLCLVVIVPWAGVCGYLGHRLGLSTFMTSLLSCAPVAVMVLA